MADQPSSLIARLIPKVTSILALLLSAWWVADGLVHPAYAVVWGVVMAIRSFRTEIGAWPEGPQKVHLPAEWQFALILGLFLATVITSPFLTWRQILYQWGIFIFAALPLYQGGLAWAWKRLTREE